MRYALATWEVRDLLLIPSFSLTAKAPSAPSSEKIQNLCGLCVLAVKS